ncbi:unnamed protein product, partial [Prorocentrum cordatum]
AGCGAPAPRRARSSSCGGQKPKAASLLRASPAMAAPARPAPLAALLLALALPAARLASDAGPPTIPLIGGELTTPAKLHAALAPAWRSLVEQRNAAGLVAPKEEGRPQPPMSEEETAFQFDRAQKGQSDSARLLLVPKRKNGTSITFRRPARFACIGVGLPLARG